MGSTEGPVTMGQLPTLGLEPVALEIPEQGGGSESGVPGSWLNRQETTLSFLTPEWEC